MLLLAMYKPALTLQVRDVYYACMNEPLIERIGLQPLLDSLHSMGGWPVIEVSIIIITVFKNIHVINNFYITCRQGASWNEANFDWIDTTYKFRANSYSTDLLIDFSITTDIKNSSFKVIDIDQASLGQSHVYLVKGMEDRSIRAYYSYMVNVAVLLGAERWVRGDNIG